MPQQETFPEMPLKPDEMAADISDPHIVSLGRGYEEDAADRHQWITELRGEDLAREQTGVDDDVREAYLARRNAAGDLATGAPRRKGRKPDVAPLPHYYHTYNAEADLPTAEEAEATKIMAGAARELYRRTKEELET